MLSLFLLLLVGLSIPLALLFSSDGSYFGSDDPSIERQQLEDQSEQIAELTLKLQTQENYLENIRKILNGEIPVDTPFDSLNVAVSDMELDSIDVQATEAEKKLSDKLRSDMSTPNGKNEQLILFASPVTGVISQKFDKKRHPGLDIVTEADRAVKACLGGTVIYSAFSRKDGYVLIIDHGNGFLSVYKHNKRALKEAGAKVKLGDPIAIVGNTGENSTGPHLHFELWLDQSPVNPKDYISFSR